MSTEQALQILRTSAGCRLGDPDYFAPARLFAVARARRSTSPMSVQAAGRRLNVRGVVEGRS